jgi:site-specific recombinase XerC
VTHLAPLVTTFLRDHLPVEQGASPHTCEAHAHASRLLFAFAGERLGLRPSQLALEQIDAPLVTAFLAHLEDVRGNGATTRNARLAAVQALMHFVEYRVSSALNQVGEIRAIPYKRHDD